MSHQSPPVLIMAAGAGTRMWPLCEQRPKPLLPVAGKPLIHHLLDGLIAIGVREVVVLVHWQGQALRRYLLSPQRQWPADLQLRLLDQGQPLGTGHAVLRGGADFQQPFLCLNGDVLVDPPALQGFVRSAIAASGPGQEVVMALTEVPDVGRYGAVTVDGPRVVGLAEKSGQARPGTINAGLYRFTPEFVALLEGLPPSPRGEVEVTDGLTRWLQQGTPVRGVPLQGRWRELTHPWDLLTLNEEWCEGLAPAVEGTVEEGVTVHGTLLLHPSATIKAGTYVEGTVIVGAEAVIGPNSYLRGTTFLDRKTKVGASCEVKNSIVLEGTHIPHHNYVGDSILGAECNLGAGTQVANLRLDGAEIHSYSRGQRMATGRRKLGVIMGDRVKTGINSSLDVGTVIGSDSLLGPGARASGLWQNGSRVF